jgi:anti-sigma-K factor RskA
VSGRERDARPAAGNGPEHPSDLLASYVLGLLDGDEHDQVEEHVRGCSTCTEEVQELRGVLDVLPFAAPPVAPPPAARQALMDRVAASRRDAPDARRDVTPAVPPKSGGWLGAWGASAGWATALACAAVAGVSVWQLAVTRNELSALRQERAAAETRLLAQIDALGQLDPQVTRVAALRGDAQAATIQGRFVYQPNSATALAVLEHLPPLQPGKTYQFWLIQGATPVSAGTFHADSAGTGSLVVRAPSAIGSYSGLGLTAEPEPGVTSPTGAILASGAL